MTISEQLLRLLEYDKWATRQIITVIEHHRPFDTSDKVLTYLSHIVGAQQVWYARVNGEDTESLSIWPEYNLKQCKALVTDMNEKWIRVVRNSRNLQDQIDYKNSQGVQYSSSLNDILHHIIIHGQHHRAQIARMLRQAGVAPPPTDYIFFTRDNNL